MLNDDVTGALILIAYYLVFVLILPTLLKSRRGINTELIRKIQHVAYSLSIFLLLELFSTWYIAIAVGFMLVLLAYPILIIIEKTPWYNKTFVDRTVKGGELRKQFIYVQLSFAVLIVIFWGLLGSGWHYVVAAAVMAWGFGDAAAALIGKAFGHRRVLHKLIDRGKTYEGTSAMMLFAGLAVFLTLFIYAGKPWYISFILSIIVAPVCGIVELFSRRGTDTLTVPLSAAFLIMPLIYLFSFLGW